MVTTAVAVAAEHVSPITMGRGSQGEHTADRG
jgi:hypothetical protein